MRRLAWILLACSCGGSAREAAPAPQADASAPHTGASRVVEKVLGADVDAPTRFDR